MVYEVCLHGYARIWFMQFGYMDMHKYVCLHGYTRINKWFMRFIYMDIHE